MQEIKEEMKKWKEIYHAFVADEDKGNELISEKHNNCGLCPKYKKAFIADGIEYLHCRDCPIVKETRRTCNYWWEKLGVKPGEDNNGNAALKTYLFLEALIKEKEVN